MASRIDEFTPYPDPRTAYGQIKGRIPVGEVTELAALPSEGATQAAKATTPAQRLPITGGAATPIMRAGGVALGAAPEAIDVGRVLANPRTTGIDVATQTAEGLGRFGSAGAGALGGAQIGGALGGPIGSAAGAVIGGIGGYFAGDKFIRGARQLAGVDPRSPVERLPETQTAAAAPAVAGVGAGAGRGFVNPAPVNPNAAPPRIDSPPIDLSGKIIRDGNSYRGNNVAFGADIVSPNGKVLTQGGGVSSFDTSAVPGILQRTSAINQRISDLSRELDAYGPGAHGGGASGIGGTTVNQDLRAKTDTRSISDIPGLSARQRATLMQRQQEADQQTSAARRGQDLALMGNLNSTSAQLGAARINAERGIEAAGIGAGASRDVARIGADARRSAAEQAALAQASNAEARAAAAEARANTPKLIAVNLPDISGPNGERLSGGQALYDQHTGKRVGEVPQSVGIANDPRALEIRNNAKLSDSEKRKQLQALGYK